jgi:MinD superfamily P-loop ATPase
MLQIKREAESQGLVTWIMNVESSKGQCSCSCCGCCCHAMRIVTDFNVPGSMAPAHFLPRFDQAKCVRCGKCARNCPMRALGVEPDTNLPQHRVERCIGCGLCVVACGDRRAVAMEAVPDYKLPYRSWFSWLLHTGPTMAHGAWNVWRSRRQ